MTKYRAKPEQSLQCAIALHLDLALPDGCWWTAVNPVPSKTKAVAGMSKAMGMKAGAPDIVLCIHGRFVGLELKSGKGRLSPAQMTARKQITLAGGVFAEVRSLNDLDDILSMLLGNELRARVAA